MILAQYCDCQLAHQKLGQKHDFPVHSATSKPNIDQCIWCTDIITWQKWPGLNSKKGALLRKSCWSIQRRCTLVHLFRQFTQQVAGLQCRNRCPSYPLGTEGRSTQSLGEESCLIHWFTSAPQSKNQVSTNIKHSRYNHLIMSNFLSIHFHTKSLYVHT